MQQIKGDDIINGTIDGVFNGQLSKIIIIEAWFYLAGTEREIQEVTAPFQSWYVVSTYIAVLPFATDRRRLTCIEGLISKETTMPRRRGSKSRTFGKSRESVRPDLNYHRKNITNWCFERYSFFRTSVCMKIDTVHLAII